MLDAFFSSWEDGLGSAENKETAKKMQNQEAKMLATNQEGCFLCAFLLSSLPPFFPLCLPLFFKTSSAPSTNVMINLR